MLSNPIFNVRFLEDIELINDVRADIQADKMKMNAILYGSNLKISNKSLTHIKSNLDLWRWGFYMKIHWKVKKESWIEFD